MSINLHVPGHIATPLLAVSVLVCGVLIALQPMFALVFVGLGFFVALAHIPPVAHLLVLVGVTAIVPFGVQNSLGIGGGAGSPGLLPSDALLIVGLLRLTPILLRRHFGARLLIGALLIGAFVSVAGLQFVRALGLGRDPSTVGAELRVLLGFATFLLAIPVVADSRQRRLLLRALPFLGLALGIWGIAQWSLGLSFSGAGDAGLREGVRLTTAGRGQVQGGLFGFPVAVVVGLAALMSGQVRSLNGRVLLVSVVVLNVVCTLLTFERTFWLATVLACGFVVIKAEGLQRARGVFGAVAGVILLFVVLSTLAPAELTTARERLLSLSQYGSDNSVRYRLTESRHVLEQISEHPLAGAGLGASIYFGRPWELVPPSSETFAHNGYLWLAWKLGIPAGLLLWLLMGAAICRRGPPLDDALLQSVVNGSQAALLGLVVTSVTFPSFNQLSITSTMGLLMALCLSPRLRTPAMGDGDPAPSSMTSVAVMAASRIN